MKLCIHMYFYLFELEWPLKITENLTLFVKHLCKQMGKDVIMHKIVSLYLVSTYVG
jgi:hypothetical protein